MSRSFYNSTNKTRNLSFGQSQFDTSPQLPHYSKKSSATVKIELKTMEKQQCFSESEIERIFYARSADLGLGYYESQYQRFKDYCYRQCINRKVKLIDLGLGERAAIELSQIIAVNDNIASLNLKKNALGDEGSKIIIKQIAKMKSIVHIDLSSNEITHKGAKKIFRSLITNNSVISLLLGNYDGVHKNKIGQKGVQYLSQFLAMNEFLMFLDLRGNLICDNGVILLCDGLEKNKSLMNLNLSNNDITSVGIEKLKDALIKSVVKDLDLSNNPIGNQGCDYLSQYIVHQDCILN